ncbi:MAG: 5-formyltetrahydrofolate cyclo-ligase [Alphaproteobacteria bacterium]|nr:5-formyltetrahydrofolate cyclo-ligase [Alphaproteobacteria bacterium]
MHPAPDRAETARLAEAKHALRRTAARVRDRLRRDIVDAGELIAAQFLARWSPPPGTAVSAFWPFRSEPDTRPLMHALVARGSTVLLPVVAGRGRPLAFRVWRPGDVLEPDGFGVQVPGPGARAGVPDWLLVPLLAWDTDRYRLGYGGGFYDITLANLRASRHVRAIGIAYDGQRVDRVPRGPLDEQLDAIVTERRIITQGEPADASPVSR